jgi:hypothetical protein
MTISMYSASVPVFRRHLANLAAVLAKAEAWCAERSIDEQALLQSRLFPDMFTLSKQVQVASDFARGGATRLAGQEPPKEAGGEQSFADLIARVERSIACLDALPASALDGAQERRITYQLGRFPIDMPGHAYLLDFALPNFFFHWTTAYDLLRHNGLAIGKGDFIGRG